MVTHSAHTGSHADEALMFFGKVTDPKPGAYGSKYPAPPNASFFYEMNGEHRIWLYDAGARQWLLQDGEPDPNYIYPFTGMRRVDPYLFEVWYDSLDYDGAYAYFLEQKEPIMGACSGVRKGKWFGRNLDWTYDQNAEFVVHIPRIEGRYASVGVVGGFAALTEAFVRSSANSDLYKVLPFQMYDGRNEHGLTVSINVVPTDYGENESIPTGESQVTISSRMVIRYLLDHFATAYEAGKFMQEHMTIYFPKTLHDMHYETHWMIADKQKTYLVEIIENQVVLTDISERAYMTNFHQSFFTPNSDGTVMTPETGDAVLQNGVTEHAAGLERFNLIAENYGGIQSLEDMAALLEKLRYTRAYSTSKNPANPIWYSEFVDGDLKVNSPITEFADIYDLAGIAYAGRSRDTGYTWQTVHSSIYDIESGELHICPQETNHVLTFK